MKYEKMQRDNEQSAMSDGDNLRWIIIVFICLLGLFALYLSGCTVTPRVVQSKAASWDGNLQNSGIIGSNAAKGGYIVTSNFVSRYNGMASDYGHYFIPPCVPADGVIYGPSNYYTIDNQHLVRYLIMTAWRLTNRPPYKP